MSVRRQAANRRTLFRTCQTCGRSIVTTADTPLVRQLKNVDGRKQKTCYFCSEHCFADSYKHKSWFDGKTEERRREREAARDIREKNRRYYATHAEQMRARRRAQYRADPESERKDAAYQRRKRKLILRNTDGVL